MSAPSQSNAGAPSSSPLNATPEEGPDGKRRRVEVIRDSSFDNATEPSTSALKNEGGSSALPSSAIVEVVLDLKYKWAGTSVSRPRSGDEAPAELIARLTCTEVRFAV